MLNGKRIVVTRAAHQSGPIQSALQSLGADVIMFPVLAIEPVADWSACDAKIRSLPSYEALIFTSVNGARYFLERTRTATGSLKDAMQQKKIYAVGGETAKTVEDFGLTALTFPEAVNSEQLMECVRQSSEAHSFLFPHGNLTDESAAEALVQDGRIVDEVIVYRNVPVQGEQSRELVDRLKAGTVDVLTFFSPSAVQALVGLTGVELVRNVPCAVIGSTTAQAAQKTGFQRIIQASFPSTDSLLNAILNYFRTPEPAGASS